MRIAFFDSYSDLSGGAPRSMLHLVKLLQEQGDTVETNTSIPHKFSEYCEFNGIHCNSIGVPAILLKRRSALRSSVAAKVIYIFNLFIFWLKLSLKLTKYKKHDVICFNDIRCFLFFLPLALIYRKKLVWYVRINSPVYYLDSIAAFLSRRIIFVSESCRNLLTSNQNLKYRDKISVVYTGIRVPTNNINTCLIPSNTFNISIVGVLSPRKNITLLIDALKLAQIDNIKVRIYGDEKVDDKGYKAILENYICKAELDSCFEFKGHCEDLGEIYSKCDALVLTSLSEGLPRVLLEALSYGCFCISTPVEGAKELLVDRKLGIVMTSYTAEELADTLLSIQEVNNLNEQLFTYRRNYIKYNFSNKNFVDKFKKSIEW